MHRVSGLVNLDWHSWVGLQLQCICEFLILTALQKLILGIDDLEFPERVRPDFIFHNDQVTGLRDREIGLRGNDQAEHLQIGGYLEATLAAIQQDLPKVLWSSFG